jgi:radical SAM protein with 4Fe4S-binding SPASM domain
MVERTKKTKSYPLSFVDNFRTVIAANGKIYPDCWTRGMDEFSLGNLHDANFSQIWKSERKKEILNSKLDKAECPPMCYHDPLNELLWNIWQQNKYGEHVNFV